jgi:hypothetical protein
MVLEQLRLQCTTTDSSSTFGSDCHIRDGHDYPSAHAGTHTGAYSGTNSGTYTRTYASTYTYGLRLGGRLRVPILGRSVA